MAPPMVALERGGTLTCQARITTVPSGAKPYLRWEVRDCFNRLLARAVTPVAANGAARAKLPLLRPVTVCHQLDTALIAGGRTLVTMKHVGVNVAADPLFTAAYTGVNAGLVVITADDPSMHSSQNEQDNRHYAIAAKLPMFEPSTPAEARQFTRWGFELSEAHDTPVFVRTTTRLSHSKGVVDGVEDDFVPLKHPVGVDQNPAKYVMIPGHARVRRVEVEARLIHTGHSSFSTTPEASTAW